jgi:hypothetical protein
MVDAEFTAEREDVIRPEAVAALDSATPESPETDAPDGGATDEGGSAPPAEDGEVPPPTAGMTSQPDGEELPPIVEADPTFEAEGGFQLDLNLDDLPLPGVGFIYEFGGYG